MNLNLLLSFINVIEQQSLTKAARKLHLTQPAVTKHLQNLEERFGTRLIDRSSTEPTAEGKVLYKYAKNIIKTYEEAELEILQMCDSMQGNLTLGASTIPGQYLMPKVLGLFKAKHPESELSLKISDSLEVINKVLDEEILIGAIGVKVNDPKLYIQEFYTDTLIFIASPASPYAHKATLNPEELKIMPFIWREKGSGTRKAAEELLRPAGITPYDLNVVMELNSTEAIVTSVESGLGISLISKCAAQRALDNGSLVELSLASAKLERKLYLIALRNNLKRKLVKTFLDEAKEIKAEMRD